MREPFLEAVRGFLYKKEMPHASIFDIIKEYRLRAWFNGRTLAFQACDEGSIPFARYVGLNAGVAQSVEHLHGKEKVVGSIPTPSFYFRAGRR